MAPVNAISIPKLDSNNVCYHYGSVHQYKNKNWMYDCYQGMNKKCSKYGTSHVRFYVLSKENSKNSEKNYDLNTVNKVVLKLDGKTVKTFYKGKNWKINKVTGNDPNNILLEYDVKKNLKGKNYSITAYNNNGKKIKSQSGKINNYITDGLDFPGLEINSNMNQ